jgi:hypothetical protein
MKFVCVIVRTVFLHRLECTDGLYCWHADAVTGDYYAEDFTTYGVCSDPESMGDIGAELDDRTGTQSIFADNGGFENEMRLRGGFVLLWSVNKV